MCKFCCFAGIACQKSRNLIYNTICVSSVFYNLICSIETHAFEDYSNGLVLFLQFQLAAFRAHLQRVVHEVLENVELAFARCALIRIDRHTLPHVGVQDRLQSVLFVPHERLCLPYAANKPVLSVPGIRSGDRADPAEHDPVFRNG